MKEKYLLQVVKLEYSYLNTSLIIFIADYFNKIYLPEYCKNNTHRSTILIGWLVGFYGISNIIGYLMPNPLFNIYQIYMLGKHIFLIKFLNFFCIHLNGSKYYYVSLTIQ